MPLTPKQKEYMKNRRVALKARGVCLNCEKNQAETGTVHCPACKIRRLLNKQAKKGTGKFDAFDYYELLKSQKGMCAICRRKPKRLELDHDHKKQKIREFLCSACNRGIGLFREDIPVIHRVIKYLEKHA